MEEEGALGPTAIVPLTAVDVLNSTINTRADTQSCTLLKLYIGKLLCLDTCLYHVIHQSYVRLLLFVVSRWETAKLCPKTDFRNLWIVSYFVLFFFSLRPMSIVSDQFCPVPTCANHVFCTLFPCFIILCLLFRRDFQRGRHGYSYHWTHV